MAVPTLVQHVSGSWTNGDAAVANGFICQLPNKSLSGNCIILAFTSKHLLTISSIVDDQSSSWAASITAAVSKDDGAGIKTWIVVLPNCAANIVKITVTMSAAGVFQYQLTEFNNVATASPIDVSVSATAVAGSSVATGSMTTTVDGDLIYQYAMCQHYPTTLGTTDNNPTTLATTPIWTAGAGFELLGGDWNTGYCGQWRVQTTHGAINPTCSISNNPATTDTFTTVAVALKSAAAGTAASGMYIAHCLHTWSVNNVSPMWVQFPCSGNLLICSATNSPINAISAITDTPGNSWDCSKNTGSTPLIAFAPNATPSITNVLRLVYDTGGQLFIVLYDVVGAATSPYDTKAVASGTSSSTNADVTHAPDITPSTANGLVVVCNTMGLGPPSGVDLPVGGIFDGLHYTNKSDTGADSGDGYAHFWNPSTAAEAWSWTMANGSVATSWAALALVFKAPAGGGGASPFVGGTDFPNISYSALRLLKASHIATRAQGEVWDNPNPIRLKGQDKFPGGAGRGPNYDWPNPLKWLVLSTRWPIDLRTHIESLNLELKGQDKFFGGAGQPPTYQPPPNPLGYKFPQEDRSFTDPSEFWMLKDTFFGGAGQPPSKDPIPNPRGYPFPVDARTEADSSEFWMLQDTFFGAPGQPPTYQPPQNPFGYRFSNELRTLLENLLQTTLSANPTPFYLSDWPNPKGYPYPLEDRTFTDPSEFWMLQDTFFGAPGEPPTQQPIPNPLGYRFSTEFRTFLQSFPQGLLYPLPFYLLDWPNPLGYKFPVEDRSFIGASAFQFLQDTFFGGPGQPPTHQPPENPLGYRFSVEFRTFLLNLLQSTLSFNPVPFNLLDWVNPRGYIFPQEDRSYTQASAFQMLQDTFYGAAGQPPTYQPPQNPLGYRFSNEFRTFLVNLLQNTLSFNPVPFNIYDWPNPKGYGFPLEDRSFITSSDFRMLQDTFFGAAGQPPTYAPAVNPRGYLLPIDARTLIVSLIATTLGILPNPFFMSDWPNPKGYTYTADLKVFVEGLQQINLNAGQKPFSSDPWQNPALKPMSRRQMMDALNLLETTLGPSSPVVTTLRRLLMGMGI